MSRLDEIADAARDIADEIPHERAGLLAAFTIGAAVGVALALIWVPERRQQRLPPGLHRRYRRVRGAGSDALKGIRQTARRTTEELREELAATLEAAREQLTEMARDQIEKARETLEREYRNLKS